MNQIVGRIEFGPAGPIKARRNSAGEYRTDKAEVAGSNPVGAQPKYDSMGDLWTMLAEECAEVIKERCKALRFGMAGSPAWLAAGHPPTRDALIQEIADVQVAIELLIRAGEATHTELHMARDRKWNRLIELYGYDAIMLDKATPW